MDHKVSKDMISSGMIPSGEKTQADLGSTQYGSAPSPRSLMDAYKSIYEHHQKDADGNTIPHEGEELNEVGFLAPLLGGLTGAVGKAAAGKFAAGAATKAAGSTVMKGGIGKTITRAGIKMGGKTGGKIAKTMVNNPTSTYMIGRDMIPKGGGGAPQSTIKKTGTGTVSASADLFDIVKGQLLDEGLSEEEIRDIMLTLTPDEIMNEMEEYKGSGTPEQQAAMKAQVEVSKKVNRYGCKTPSGTTAVDAKKGIEDVRKSM